MEFIQNSVMRVNLSGFSLLELLIAMAMAAILTVIAYPAYRYYLVAANRRSAEVGLLRIASRLKEFHSLNETYQGATLSHLKIENESRDYLFQLSQLTTESYLIKAIPQAKQAADHCGTLSIDQSGHQKASESGCWN
ncbi:MAG: type IV pilin protein [Coxiella burnetii]|nr:type IV pilin protein [Coxiella burnetii]